MQPKIPFFQRLFNLTNKIIEIDFDFSVIAIDKKQKMPNDKCFIFYNQPQSIGVNLELIPKSPVASDYDEIISIDFNLIIQEVQCLKFILSNFNNEYFNNCKVQCTVYDKSILIGTNGVELYNFNINSKCQFKLLELFEINIFNPREWNLNVLENYHNYDSKNPLSLHLNNFT